MALAIAGIVAAGFGFTHVPDGPGPGPDLDCADIGHQVKVGSFDPHGLDADGDGIGCERDGKKFGWLGWVGLVGVAAGVVQTVRIIRRD